MEHKLGESITSIKPQTRSGSLLESLIAAFCAAPTAILLHKALLVAYGGNLVSNDVQNMFVFLSWISFFLHSVIWNYIWRRTFQKFGIEPKTIADKIRSMF